MRRTRGIVQDPPYCSWTHTAKIFASGCEYLSVAETLIRGRAANMELTWVAKSASWYMNDPLKKAKFGI